MKKISVQKNKSNELIKYTSLCFALLIAAVFLVLILFIFISAIQGFNNFGIANILFQFSFDQSEDKFSFWVPFSATILTSFIALLVSIPIGIKVAILTKYRLKKRIRKYVLITFQTLSGIPSVIFGFFAAQSLGIIWQKFFNINANSIFNGSMMLAFMVIPTIVSMILDSLNNIDDNLLLNSQVLGNSKTRSIYKVCKKAAKSGIIVAVIVSLARVLGESMAISMILQSQPNYLFEKNDFLSLLNSSSQTLGAYISTAMFADKDPEKMRPLLYSFGLIMLIFSMILNLFILFLSRKRTHKIYSRFKKIENLLDEYIFWVPRQIKILCEKISFKSEYSIGKNNLNDVVLYIKHRSQKYKFSWLYPSWKIFWEILAVSICFTFMFWIIGDVVFNGILGVRSEPNNFFVYSKNSISQSFVNTLLIIIVCLAIGFPISLMCAIFLNEFSKEGKFKKTIIFFLDSLNTTPSIIFGMFGLLLFIQTFGWTSNGKLGNSLIAGALTLIIVVVPSFVRLLGQSLKNVPNEIRVNSYALGNTKWETIRKLILPIALISIISSVISTIGRIFSETAPLYLTAGLSSSSVSVLNQPGTTLTTHIYAQIFSSKENAVQIQYQAAILSLIIVFVLITIGYIIIPNWKFIKHKIIKEFNDMKIFFLDK